MLFMHNNNWLTGLLTYFVLPEKIDREIFEIFHVNISRNISRQKNHEILHH